MKSCTEHSSTHIIRRNLANFCVAHRFAIPAVQYLKSLLECRVGHLNLVHNAVVGIVLIILDLSCSNQNTYTQIDTLGLLPRNKNLYSLNFLKFTQVPYFVNCRLTFETFDLGQRFSTGGTCPFQGTFPILAEDITPYAAMKEAFLRSNSAVFQEIQFSPNLCVRNVPSEYINSFY